MAINTRVKDNAKLMAEWNIEKNDAIMLDPAKLTIGSQKTAYWICTIHKTEFSQIIRSRNKGLRGCPKCQDEWSKSLPRERYIKNKSVLAETHPYLVDEWVGCENPKYTPETCVAGSNIKARWKCKNCSGEYESYVYNRALNGAGCPYCAGQKVLVGYNDLQSQFPSIIAEWSNRNTIKPSEVTIHSNKKVFWVCPLGHSDYLMTIKQRSNRRGCPICAQQSQTSFPEQAIYFYIKQVYRDAINRYKINGREIDIYIPTRRIGIEYNGYYSHRAKDETDICKKEYISSLGIALLSVKEFRYDSEKKHNDFYISERTSYNDLTVLIQKLLERICPDIPIDVNCSRDALSIKNQYVTLRKENSIATVRPDIVDRWDYEKNGSITPEMVTIGTGMRFYWKCKICSNSYLALPSEIANGSVCSKHRNLLKNKGNDLATKHPELLKYWDFEENDVNPSEIYGGGEKVVHWKCEKGHKYTKAIIKTIHGEGCPICAGKKVLIGYNDLATICPDVAKSWDYKKNGIIKPTDVTAHSNKKYWWICEYGHEWEARVQNRTSGQGCPECYNVQRRNRKINMYDVTTLELISTFDNTKSVCEHLGLNHKNMNGTISRICRRQQKTLLGKYILRYASDDEYIK